MKSANCIIGPGSVVAVLGLGVSGRAAARYALHCRARVLISDLRPAETMLAEDRQLLQHPDVEWESGAHRREFLSRAEILLVSPGVDNELPLLQQLRDDGVRIVGELAVVADRIAVPLVAVTGTNGKTTVTTLIGELLRAAGKKVFVGGNIGTPLYDYLCAPQDYDVVVAEVSSFQLEHCGSFAPNIGVLLNITPDHLDRHRTMEKYIGAKANLFGNQGTEGMAIINGDDPVCMQVAGGLKGAVTYFGKVPGHTARIEGGKVTLQREGCLEEYDLVGSNLAGNIGMQNGAAAIVAARALGCGQEQIRQALRDFVALPHRIEFIAAIDGVAYYNDSKATNTGAVISALGQFKERIVLIAGGRDKGDDYRLLRESVSSRVAKMIVIGEAASQLDAALSDVVPTVHATSIEQAVELAAQCADAGDVVLLSPACASFDMFKSYKHRGDSFKAAVLAMHGTGYSTGSVGA